MALPDHAKDVDVRVIFERPPSKDRIFESRLVALKTVPSWKTSLEALATLTKALEKGGDNPWGIEISGAGKFSDQAVRLLPNVAKTTAFVRNAKALLAWMEKELSASDQDFGDWFRALLFDSPGIMNHQLKPTPGVPLEIVETFSVRDEEYINDEVIRTALDVFSEFYGEEDRYLFVSPIRLTLWTHNISSSWHWKKDQIKAGLVEKVVMVVYMSSHWGVIEVDFTRCKISFGDSLSRAVPYESVNAVREWISRCGVDVEQWDRGVSKLWVSQQPPGSGSCAVNALNAVETCVNPAVERWTHARSAHHRMRLLQLVTGYTKVKIYWLSLQLSLHQLPLIVLLLNTDPPCSTQTPLCSTQTPPCSTQIPPCSTKAQRHEHSSVYALKGIHSHEKVDLRPDPSSPLLLAATLKFHEGKDTLHDIKLAHGTAVYERLSGDERFDEKVNEKLSGDEVFDELVNEKLSGDEVFDELVNEKLSGDERFDEMVGKRSEKMSHDARFNETASQRVSEDAMSEIVNEKLRDNEMFDEMAREEMKGIPSETVEDKMSNQDDSWEPRSLEVFESLEELGAQLHRWAHASGFELIRSQSSSARGENTRPFQHSLILV